MSEFSTMIDFIKYGVMFVFFCAAVGIAGTAAKFLWDLWRKNKL